MPQSMPTVTRVYEQSESIEAIRSGIATLLSGINQYQCMLAPKLPRPMRKQEMLDYVKKKKKGFNKPARPTQIDWDQMDVPFPADVPDKVDLPRPTSKRGEQRDAHGSLKFREKVSAEMCENMVAATNRYWKALTGRSIHFKFYPEQQPYISPIEHSMVRNRILMSMCLKQPDILEIGVGAGSEFLSILFMMNPRSLVGLEPSDEDVAGKDAWQIAQENLNNWYKAWPEYNWSKQVPHRLLQMTAADYLGKIKPGRYWAITLLDPPFKNGHNMTFEDDLRTSLKWVMQDVLEPMFRHKHKTSIFVLKSRYPPGKVSEEWQKAADEIYRASESHSAFMRNMVFYDSIGACPFTKQVDYAAIEAGQATRGVFYWVFFSRMEDRIHAVANSALWNATVKTGKTVYVPQKDLVHPDFTYDYAKFTGNHNFHSHMHEGDEEVKGVPRPNKAPDNVTEEALHQAFAHASVHERNRPANPYTHVPGVQQPDTGEETEPSEEGWTYVRRAHKQQGVSKKSKERPH